MTNGDCSGLLECVTSKHWALYFSYHCEPWTRYGHWWDTRIIIYRQNILSGTKLDEMKGRKTRADSEFAVRDKNDIASFKKCAGMGTALTARHQSGLPFWSRSMRLASSRWLTTVTLAETATATETATDVSFIDHRFITHRSYIFRCMLPIDVSEPERKWNFS